LLKDYDKAKQDKLEKIADKMLKHDSKNQQLKNKNVNPKFLDLF